MQREPHCFKGDEAKDDNHGLALHLPHLEHLHLPQGELLTFFSVLSAQDIKQDEVIRSSLQHTMHQTHKK